MSVLTLIVLQKYSKIEKENLSVKDPHLIVQYFNKQFINSKCWLTLYNRAVFHKLFAEGIDYFVLAGIILMLFGAKYE